MCMTMAFSWGDGCIVATDTRNTMKYHDGRIVRRDTGGKLMRIGGAWVTATGCGFYLDEALSALSRVDCTEPDAVSAALHEAQQRRPSSTPNTRVLVATDTHFGFFDASGELVGWQTRGVRAVWPDLEPDEIEARGPRLPVELGACRSVHDAMRVFAQHFAEVAELHDSVSPVVQIAGKDHAPWFLEADARALSRMSDAEIAALRQPAPAPDLHAFTRIAREVEPDSIAADGSIASPAFDVDALGVVSIKGPLAGDALLSVDGRIEALTLSVLQAEITDLSGINANFSGTLIAANGEFTGTLTGVDGTFSGDLEAARGSFDEDGFTLVATSGGAQLAAVEIRTESYGQTLGIGATGHITLDPGGDTHIASDLQLSGDLYLGGVQVIVDSNGFLKLAS